MIARPDVSRISTLACYSMFFSQPDFTHVVDSQITNTSIYATKLLDYIIGFSHR